MASLVALLVTRHAKNLIVVEAQRRECMAPDAASIERLRVRCLVEPQRGPVAGNHSVSCPCRVGQLEPRCATAWDFREGAIKRWVDAGVGKTHADAGEIRQHSSPAFAALQGRRPTRCGDRADKVDNVAAPSSGSQDTFDFASVAARSRKRPMRMQTSVHHRDAIGVVQQRPKSQPIEQCVAIWRL